MPEMVEPQPPLPVDQQQGRRALHRISAHRGGQAVGADMRVDRDRETDPIFVEERRQRLGRALRCVMLEHAVRSEEHTSELQSLMRISYAVFCLKKKTINQIFSCYYYLFYNYHNKSYDVHKIP